MRTLIKNIIDIRNAVTMRTTAFACTRRFRRVYTTAVVFVVLVSLLSPQLLFLGQTKIANAAFNKEINYQGKLTNSSNVAVADGTYHMRFKLYTVATGGVSIWDEDRSTAAGDRITLTNGLFSVMLGSSTALTGVDFNQTLYLGVEVGGSAGAAAWDGEMTPRKKLGAVPAAFVADTVDNISSEQFLRADATNATNTASVFLTITQNGAGDIANFIGPSSASVLTLKSGGNIGIGTTSPWARLSVASYNAGTQPQFVIASSTGVSATSTQFIVDHWGNVGIGTVSPNAKLEINGDLYFTSAGINRTIGFDAAGGGRLSILGADTTTTQGGDVFIGAGSDTESQASGGSVFIYAGQGNANGNVVLGHNSVSAFGNVGVGTATPSTKFAVHGNGYFSSTLFVGGAITSTSSSASTFPYASTTAITVSGTASTTALNISGISGCSGSSALTTDASGVVACGAISGGSAFPFTPATNFGVNTSATSTALWAQAGIFASSTSQFAAANFSATSTFTTGLYIGTTSANAKLAIVGSTITGFGNNEPGLKLLTVATSSDRDVLAVYNQYVQIGTYQRFTTSNSDLNPSGLPQLLVAGDISFPGIASITTRRIFIGKSSNDSAGSHLLLAAGAAGSEDMGGSTSGGNIYIRGGASSGGVPSYDGNVLIADTGGRVGVGTSTPWAKLSIGSHNSLIPQFVIASSSTGVATSTQFIVNIVGNVGIGTSSPAQKLDVVGNLVAGFSNAGNGRGVLLGNIVGDSTYPGIWFGANTVAPDTNSYSFLWDAGEGTIFNTPSGKSMGFRVNNATKATLSSVGNFGIGTTSAYAKLSVVGQTVSAYFTATTSTASTFPYASTTAITVSGTASTTALNISGISGCSGSSALTTDASGVVACGAISGGSAFPFTPATNFGVNTSATSTALWAQAGIFASSTSQFANATATMLTVTGTAYFPSFGIWNSSGNLGIGTTSPYAKLSVHLRSTETNTTIFSIASSTATATTTLFSVSNTGITTIGDSAGTGDSNLQFANDNDAWSMGFSSSDKSFRVASSTSLSTNVGFVITKGSSLSVGVGTSSPWRAFAVTGTVGFDGLTSSIGAGSLCLSSNKEVVYNSGSDNCLSSLASTKHDIKLLDSDALALINGLKSKSFIYNEGDGRVRYGFIAEDTAAVDSHLTTYNELGNLSGIDDRAIISISVKAIQQLNFNLESIASSTLNLTDNTTASSTNLFAKKFFVNIFERITQWLADASNQIENVFAQKFTASEKICVDNQCLTKEDVKKLLLLIENGQSAEENNGNANSSTSTPPTSDDTQAPVITLEGDNPVKIFVGETYVDAGVVITDNVDEDVDYVVSVDGGGFVKPDELFIDTNEKGKHSIIYSATDHAGNNNTISRVVVVENEHGGSDSSGSESNDSTNGLVETPPDVSNEETSASENTPPPEEIPEPSSDLVI